MPPFNIIINFSCCLQLKTNPPCHGPYTKRGGRLISAQAARVSLVTAGSRYSHGSAQLNDCALMAFPNPFEINLIFIYLQLPSLEVERIREPSCRRVNHTQAHTISCEPIHAPPPGQDRWQEGLHSPPPTPPRHMDSLPRLPWWTLPSHISFFPLHGQSWLLAPLEKPILPRPFRKSRTRASGCTWKNLVTSKLAPFVEKFKESHHHDFNEATIRVAFFQHHVESVLPQKCEVAVCAHNFSISGFYAILLTRNSQLL